MTATATALSIDCACTGKTRFDNRAQAVLVLERRPYRGKDSKSRMAYHCQNCGGWHLGGVGGQQRTKGRGK